MINLVEEYADPNIGASLGLQGEMLVLRGFARLAFVMRGRDVQAYGGRQWQESGHDVDYLFERDGIMYGVEVKNTLGYMDYEEFQTKIRLCQFLGVRPVFAVRMLPRTWIRELIAVGGFALVLRYQLYPGRTGSWPDAWHGSLASLWMPHGRSPMVPWRDFCAGMKGMGDVNWVRHSQTRCLTSCNSCPFCPPL